MIVLLCLLCSVTVAKADTITFSPLGGANLDPYAGHVEAGYTVTPTAGNWFQAQIFGNPVPSIVAGPIFTPSTSAITITGGIFTFSSVQMVSQNGTSTYLFEGFSGLTLLYSSAGAIPAITAFNTYNNPFSAVAIDRLVITIFPTGQPSSMNVDNITLFRAAEVPEPATIVLLGSGIAGIAARLRRKRRQI